MQAKLIWATPGGDKLVAYMARVSSPQNQDNEETAARLISFLIRNRHWKLMRLSAKDENKADD